MKIKRMMPSDQVLTFICQWMMARGYATGPGDSIADLLSELEAQAKSSVQIMSLPPEYKTEK